MDENGAFSVPAISAPSTRNKRVYKRVAVLDSSNVKTPVLVTLMMSNVKTHDGAVQVATHGVDIFHVVEVPFLTTSPQLGAHLDAMEKSGIISAIAIVITTQKSSQK